jgi:hypothetical protein
VRCQILRHFRRRGFIARLALEGTDGWPLAWDYSQRMLSLRAPEVSSPMTAALLLVLAVAVTLLAAWRSGRGAEYRAIWAAAAALVAPVSAVTLELFWAPSLVIGAYPWALHVIVLAALMAFLATRFAAADGEDRRRAAYAALATLSLIALALFLILTKGALTLALAALVLVAAALDRRFRLPEMTYFIQAAVVGLSWRLVVDPGLPWAIDEAALWEVIASYGGAAAAMVGGLRILEGMDRRNARVFLESAGAAYAALFANVLITRWLTDGASEPWVLSHWALTLNAMPWLILALTQLYRLQLGGALRWLRWAIAAVAGLAALAGNWLGGNSGQPAFWAGFRWQGRVGLWSARAGHALGRLCPSRRHSGCGASLAWPPAAPSAPCDAWLWDPRFWLFMQDWRYAGSGRAMTFLAHTSRKGNFTAIRLRCW